MRTTWGRTKTTTKGREAIMENVMARVRGSRPKEKGLPPEGEVQVSGMAILTGAAFVGFSG